MKALGACSKMIALFFALAFVISALIALNLFNVQGKLLRSETYKDALEEQSIYERFPSLLTKQIATSMTYNPCHENPEQCEGEGQVQDPEEAESGGPPSYLKNLTHEQWERLLSQVLTPEWTQAQTESALDQLFTFPDSDEDTLSITISLVDLKANLTGQKGLDVALELINAQPPCTEQLLDTLFSIDADDFTLDELLACAPPEDFLENLTPDIEAALNEAIQEIPDEAKIGQNLFSGEDDRESQGPMDGPGISIRTVQFIMRFSPLLPLLCLALLTLFGVRSLKDLLLWWGIPFVIVGLSALALVLVGLPILNWGFNTYVEVRIPDVLDPEFIDIGFETLRLLFRSLLRSIAIQAGVIAMVGLLMTGAGLFVRYSSSKVQSV